MRITDELMEYVGNFYLFRYKDVRERLTAIADRIDAEHEKALREAYAKGCEDGTGVANAKDAQAEYLRGKNDGYDEGWDDGFASADDWLGQHEDAMAEHGWYRALDADKQPIKFDGEVEYNGVVSNVLGIAFHGTTPPTVCIVRGGCWVEADKLRHYHAPTVEDVLREFEGRLAEVGTEDMCVGTDADLAREVVRRERAEVYAEYAAKLRLAGDDE